MPSVIINDVELEAKVGERLLNVARRNAAHIGFVCDGNGVCQTCQCRVLYGADQLSPPSEAELTWMPDRRLAEGHRLACQAVLRGSGPVKVLTKAEELRRQTLDVLRPPAGEDWRDRLEPLLDNLVRMNIDQLARYPLNLVATLARVGPWRFTYPLLDAERWADDGARVARRMAAGADRLERAPLGDGATRVAGDVSVPPLTRIAAAREEQIVEAVRALRRAREDVRRYS
ncbi:MAG TPA: 2Fe-2S iron-sulfur cluster-binding protein [Chloroflexaceae bacterium]|nr:2Fe-2S iron-sulfur cluster-binding protein [Chloroflexaceae bacterium]